MPERIVLIGKESSATAMLYNSLREHFEVSVFIEEAPSTLQLLRWRAKHNGWWKVMGQVLFQVLIARSLMRRSVMRRAAIMREHGVSDQAIPTSVTITIRSVNAPSTWEAVAARKPRAVVINGTRILSKRTIAALGVPVLNTHVGITPMYRGVHGAYWALVNDDRTHCGVTVHLVDAGVDTGDVLHQATITPTAEDDFSTYPTIQMAVGCWLMIKAVREVIGGSIFPERTSGESKRWFHPTLGEYLRHRRRTGVR